MAGVDDLLIAGPAYHGAWWTKVAGTDWIIEATLVDGQGADVDVTGYQAAATFHDADDTPVATIRETVTQGAQIQCGVGYVRMRSFSFAPNVFDRPLKFDLVIFEPGSGIQLVVFQKCFLTAEGRKASFS